jgi:hypothetical protein
LKYFDYFYYGGNYVDVEISESDMKSFLQNEKLVLENLTDQYIKKINQFKH